jgi:hypothetical protein
MLVPHHEIVNASKATATCGMGPVTSSYAESWAIVAGAIEPCAHGCLVTHARVWAPD